LDSGYFEIKCVNTDILNPSLEDVYIDILGLVTTGNTYNIIVNTIIYREITEGMLLNILNNDIKHIDIVYTGEENNRKITYNYELGQFFHARYKNNPEETTRLVNIELIKSGHAEYIDLL
jgi:hypothetical protein